MKRKIIILLIAISLMFSLMIAVEGEVIYMPKDPRYEGWEKAAESFGLGFGEMAGKKRQEGLFELKLLLDQGGIIAEDDIPRLAKKCGISYEILFSILKNRMEPQRIPLPPKTIKSGCSTRYIKNRVGYRILSESEHKLKLQFKSDQRKNVIQQEILRHEQARQEQERQEYKERIEKKHQKQMDELIEEIRRLRGQLQ